ncbi:hypothetical protein CDAR_309741 [Caerostris darwini]|uniref:Uncharacterized protein n=1 Tax=Caerostris darwini TaxID=1538125 RepID=A0AAV4VY94_9ARAC|nr:hypothetical protein CDAR_309741 [Caerostris darwini]
MAAVLLAINLMAFRDQLEWVFPYSLEDLHHPRRTPFLRQAKRIKLPSTGHPANRFVTLNGFSSIYRRLPTGFSCTPPLHCAGKAGRGKSNFVLLQQRLANMAGFCCVSQMCLRPDDPSQRVRNAGTGQRLPSQVFHVRQMPQPAGAGRPLQPDERQRALRTGLYQNAQGDRQPRRGQEDQDEGQLSHQSLTTLPAQQHPHPSSLPPMPKCIPCTYILTKKIINKKPFYGLGQAMAHPRPPLQQVRHGRGQPQERPHSWKFS